jgi:hypothetical protein
MQFLGDFGHTCMRGIPADDGGAAVPEVEAGVVGAAAP